MLLLACAAIHMPQVPSKIKTTNFHLPLQPGDSEAQTVGCRQTVPVNCARHSMEEVCAFVRRDGICLAPPGSWPKQFKNLQGQAQLTRTD